MPSIRDHTQSIRDHSQSDALHAHERTHIRFILSRGAGKGLANELISEILSHYPHATHTSVGASRKEAGTVTISLTRGPDDVYTLAREWDKWWGARGVIYVAGGDGSVNEVGSALAGKECAFGVLPMGTGNDFARMLYNGNISKKHALSLVEKTLHPTFGRSDLLKVNDYFSVNVFSLGYDTEVLQEALAAKDKHPNLGSMAYVAGVAATAFREKTINLHIEYRYSPALAQERKQLNLSSHNSHKTSSAHISDDEGWVKIEQDCSVLLVGNGQYYGSGYRPLPHAHVDDACADLLYVDTVNLAQFGMLLGSYRKGSHLKNSKVHTARVTDVRVRRTDGLDLLWNVDGIIHKSKSVAVSLIPNALTLAYLS